MRDLTMADFAPFQGRTVSVEVQGGTLPLLLAQLEELPGSARSAGSFRIEFEGPVQPMLAQGTYRFHLGGEPSEIFIVPLGPKMQAIRYEAIFF